MCSSTNRHIDQTHSRTHFSDIVSEERLSVFQIYTVDTMATIKPSFLYGVRSGVRGGIHFSGEQRILYPAGSGVARYEFFINE